MAINYDYLKIDESLFENFVPYSVSNINGYPLSSFITNSNLLSAQTLLANLFNNYYGYYTIQSSLPSTGSPYQIIYNTTDNNIYIWNQYTNSWKNIHWQNLIQSTPEYQNGSLSINSNNELYFLSNGSWYQVYPLFGALNIEIGSYDQTNYTIQYYLPPGITAIIREINHLPIVFNPTIISIYEYTYFNYADPTGCSYFSYISNNSSYIIEYINDGTDSCNITNPPNYANGILCIFSNVLYGINEAYGDCFTAVPNGIDDIHAGPTYATLPTGGLLWFGTMYAYQTSTIQTVTMAIKRLV